MPFLCPRCSMLTPEDSGNAWCDCGYKVELMERVEVRPLPKHPDTPLQVGHPRGVVPNQDGLPDSRRRELPTWRGPFMDPITGLPRQPAAEPTVEPSCGSCRFWDRLRTGGIGALSTATGECKRLPPQVMSTVVSEERGDDADWLTSLWRATYYPVTDDDDWCGEFAPRPAKVEGKGDANA